MLRKTKRNIKRKMKTEIKKYLISKIVSILGVSSMATVIVYLFE